MRACKLFFILLTFHAYTVLKNMEEPSSNIFLLHEEKRLLEAIEMTIRDLENFPDEKIDKNLIIEHLRSILETQSRDILRPVHPDLMESPESRVFRNSLIITELFHHLPKNEHQNYRHINRHCLVTWTRSIPIENDFSLKFTFNPTKNQYENPHGSLRDLASCLEDSVKFPCTNFEFSGGYLQTPDIPAFLQLHGHFIKTLSLEISCQDPTQGSEAVTAVRRLLTAVAPSLENLTIKKLALPNMADVIISPFSLTAEFGFPQFKKMETINIVHYNIGVDAINKQIVLEILASSPNLREIDGLGDNWEEDVVKIGKIHAIKSLEVLLNGNRIRRYEKFAQYGCQLKKIHFNCIRVAGVPSLYPRISAMVTKILDSSKNSLETIEWFDELAFLGPELKPPRFERVASLVLRCRLPPSETPRLMPEGSNFAHIFPNLVTLEIFGPSDTTLWSRDLAFVDPVLSVQNLTLRSTSVHIRVGEIGRIFPNVKNLEVSVMGINECPLVLRESWLFFKKLEQFILHTEAGERDQRFFAKMDSAITGIGEERCEQLSQNLDNGSVEEVGKFRIGPSIFDAESLKIFKFSVRPTQGNFPRMPIFSHVAGMYGFQPMRQSRGLLVTLETNEWKREDPIEFAAFSLVAPYVDSVSSSIPS